MIELLSCLWLGWGEMDMCGQIVSCHAMPLFHVISILQITLVVSVTSSSHFPCQQFSAVYWIGDGGLQASLPRCPAKSSERIRWDDHHEVFDRSICPDIPRGNVDTIQCLVICFSLKGISRLGLATPLL
jgi:hypothetical protein